MLQTEVASLDVAKHSETFDQSLEQGAFLFRTRGVPQNSHFRDAAPLLSARGERPRGRRAGEKRHELTAAQHGCASAACSDKCTESVTVALRMMTLPRRMACSVLRPALDRRHCISTVVFWKESVS